MDVCKKCGEILQMDYEQCPFCGTPLAEECTPEEQAEIEEKRKQAHKKYEEERKAMLKTHVKYRKLATTFCIITLLCPFACYLVIPLGIPRAWIVFLIIFIICFLLALYFACIKGGSRCPYCGTILGKHYGEYCRHCGKELPPLF